MYPDVYMTNFIFLFFNLLEHAFIDTCVWFASFYAEMNGSDCLPY
jgi:hypothetical protein